MGPDGPEVVADRVVARLAGGECADAPSREQTVAHEVFAMALDLILAVDEILQTGAELRRSQTLRETRGQPHARRNQQHQPPQNH